MLAQIQLYKTDFDLDRTVLYDSSFDSNKSDDYDAKTYRKMLY